MSFTAFFLILASTVLHASWNLMSKARRPSLVFYLQASLTALLLWLPLMIWSDVSILNMPPVFYMIVLASGGCEILYFVGLANAYRRADISMAYPMVRSLPVLLTALLTLIFGLGTPPSSNCWLGMGMISVGCLVMPLGNFTQFRWQTYMNPMIVFILLGACGTTGYTIFDSLAMREMRLSMPDASRVLQSCVYLGWMELLIALGLSIAILCTPPERREFCEHFGRSPYPLLSGVCSSTAYALVLLAMGFVSNVSFVQAFRQLSLPICVIASSLLLKEKMRPPRLVGFMLIFGGLLLSVL